MKNATKLASNLIFSVMMAVLVTWFAAFPTPATAQGSQGQDAVYNSSNGVVGSSSFIDASMFADTTICSTIYNILKSPLYSASVIDARGLNSGNTNMTCASGWTPWNNGTTFQNKPSTILLPATGANPIIIPSAWVLPPNTHLIGEGDGIPSSGFTPGTTIQATTSFSGGTMIQFVPTGTSCSPPSRGAPSPCTGISVERLTLDGQGQSINGITNQLSNDQSYLNHVGLYRILGTGLWVSGSASDSGPYSNITFDLGGLSGTTSTICVNINGLSGTRGIHGLNCISENNEPPAAVLLDSSNNSLEDVRIAGFQDGVLVGANANAQSNVLINIIGDTTPSGVTPVNTVHISGNGHTITDLSIMGLSNSGVSGTYTLWDQVTGPHLLDPTVGIYALGESPSSGIGHSRFSTSPNVAHWNVGQGAPTTTGCNQGSLYSCTNGPGGAVNCTNNGIAAGLWVCGPSSTWLPIK
jgi:hypothetical protein